MANETQAVEIRLTEEIGSEGAWMLAYYNHDEDRHMHQVCTGFDIALGLFAGTLERGFAPHMYELAWTDDEPSQLEQTDFTELFYLFAGV